MAAIHVAKRTHHMHMCMCYREAEGRYPKLPCAAYRFRSNHIRVSGLVDVQMIANIFSSLHIVELLSVIRHNSVDR